MNSEAKMNKNRLFQMVLIAEMGAISVILAKFTRFPIFPSAPFLKMDLGELPLLLCVILLPGWRGLVALLVKECLSFLLFGTNLFGLTADFLACGAFLAGFLLLYQKKPAPSLRRFSLAVGLASIFRMLFSIPLNLVILQLQYGSTIETIWLQMPYIVPFNGLKCLLDGVCIALMWKQLQNIWHGRIRGVLQP